MACSFCDAPHGCDPGTKWPDGGLCPYSISTDPKDLAREIQELQARVTQLEEERDG